MTDVVRLFVAVQIPLLPKLKAVLKSLAAMGWPVKAVAVEKLHVTLKFLGDTSLARVPDIQAVINAAVAQCSPLVIRVEQLGAFPKIDRPSVIWAGLSDADPLVRIAEHLDASCVTLGFVREQRPFQPHLTLARIQGRPPQSLFDLLRDQRQSSFGTIPIDSLELIRSELHPEGARYTTVSTHPFGTA